MKPILPVAVGALLLSGCADGYVKTAEAPVCKRLVGKDQPLPLPGSGAGLVMTGGYVIPARDVGARGKLSDWPNVPACIRQEPGETTAPKSYDWHKVGIAL